MIYYPQSKDANRIASGDGHCPDGRAQMKLWKVTVNNWGWDRPKTLYFRDKIIASSVSVIFPASDHVVYAGNCREDEALTKLDYTDSVLVPAMW